jgi:uncharacterized BrkB/YihY/UPF0761 family membrane protein
MIQDNIESLVATTQNSGQILTFGLIGAIWVGSSAVSATIKALNRAYGVVEVLPGAAMFTVLWYFLSNAFGAYVSNFSYYNMMTGVLSGFIVLLLWIYLTALILLMGGELNAEVVNGKYESNKSEG